MSTEVGIAPGDVLRIERRYVVDGQLTCVTDQGRFERIERVGSSEHIVLRDAKSKKTRLFPLHAIAEITLVRVGARKGKKAETALAEAATPEPAYGWDPSFA
jgi:hypothetical protein